MVIKEQAIEWMRGFVHRLLHAEEQPGRDEITIQMPLLGAGCNEVKQIGGERKRRFDIDPCAGR